MMKRRRRIRQKEPDIPYRKTYENLGMEMKPDQLKETTEASQKLR
ncbi:MAG: hypothetical protein R3C11_05070 [Planctomycetaceae bacterium]